MVIKWFLNALFPLNILLLKNADHFYGCSSVQNPVLPFPLKNGHQRSTQYFYKSGLCCLNYTGQKSLSYYFRHSLELPVSTPHSHVWLYSKTFYLIGLGLRVGLQLSFRYSGKQGWGDSWMLWQCWEGFSNGTIGAQALVGAGAFTVPVLQNRCSKVEKRSQIPARIKTAGNQFSSRKLWQPFCRGSLMDNLRVAWLWNVNGDTELSLGEEQTKESSIPSPN